jgi:hypothetical protein
VIAALATTAVMGFAAISIDVGRMYAARQRLVDVCDAAALAGAQELPDDPGGAIETALEYVQRNGVDPAGVAITVSHENSRIRVVASETLDITFGRVLGFGTARPGAVSVVEVGAMSSVTGAAPFGIEMDSFETGELYDIKLGSGSGGHHCGNFHALALGGSGADNYRDLIEHGYPGLISVGDEIETEPGNMEGPTRDGLQARYDLDPTATFETVATDSPRVLFVPLVSSFEDCYGRSMVRVLGFGAFFLEDRHVGGSIRGRFMRVLTEGEMSPGGSDYGLRSFRFIAEG